MAERRIRIILIGVGGLFLAVVAQLSGLQLGDAARYRAAAEEKRRSTVPVRPVRGTVYDRNGLALALDVTRFDVDFVPRDAEKAEGGLDAVLRALHGISGEEFDSLRRQVAQIESRVNRLFDKEIEWLERRNLLAREGSRRRTRQGMRLLLRLRERPYRLLKDVGAEVRDRLYLRRLPGVVIVARPHRTYPRGPLAAHVLGYLGELSSEEYERREIDNYFRERLEPDVGRAKYEQLARGNLFRFAHYGVAGIEKQYDEMLRGHHGVVVRRATREGKVTAYDIAPTRGRDLYLTLDADLQQLAEDAMARRGQPGAVVALDPNNGEVLAMASWPTYNPNVRSSLAGGENAPTLNRPIAGRYPPGSTIKPLDAIAALHEITDFANRRFLCEGSITIGGTRKNCMGTHGSIALIEAIQRSCNVFFYKTGLTLMNAKTDLHGWMQRFGMDAPTGVDIPGEKSGQLPEPVYAGDVANHAIGQAFTTTPLRMAVLCAVMANGGKRVIPHLRKEAQAPPVSLELDPLKLAIVQEGMERVVNEPGGTGYRAFSGADLGDATVGGKTGSAQTGRAGEKPHAWFIGYAKREGRAICIAVVVERAGSGGRNAAPIARKLMEYWYGAR